MVNNEFSKTPKYAHSNQLGKLLRQPSVSSLYRAKQQKNENVLEVNVVPLAVSDLCIKGFFLLFLFSQQYASLFCCLHGLCVSDRNEKRSMKSTFPTVMTTH